MSRGTLSTAVQGGVGAFWREKVEGVPQTPPAGDVVPAGPPAGPVPDHRLRAQVARSRGATRGRARAPIAREHAVSCRSPRTPPRTPFRSR